MRLMQGMHSANKMYHTLLLFAKAVMKNWGPCPGTCLKKLFKKQIEIKEVVRHVVFIKNIV